MDAFKAKFGLNTWHGWVALLVVGGLGVADAINRAYGTAFHVPEAVWPVLAALGVTLKPSTSGATKA